MTGTDRSWLNHGACTQRPDLDWFDIDCNLEACINVCRSCTVQTQCLDEAIRIDAIDGIWGGVWGYRLVQAKRGRRGGTHEQG
jgi:ribonuclease I